MIRLKENEVAWKTLLNSEAGSKLVTWLLETFDSDTSLFDATSPTKTAFYLGQRDIARTLKHMKEKDIHAA